jgi:hypothetical protein
MNELHLIYPCYNTCYYDSGFIDGYILGFIAIILLASMIMLFTIEYDDDENKEAKKNE